ncbi:hypothetical protein CTI12_AA617400 [Artemisia annua]|uniref:Aminoacyl-tRNA synthetase class Ia domain-containing protein n=1 Tax=Artemisia annua TaxID=35608 RepID=A0A2U1KCW4_ARTAN|nr:hypothetical protein CTI12_AA617400 [Artemisia annua]
MDNVDLVLLASGEAVFSFPKEEQSILRRWNETKAFEQQLQRTKHLPEYVFYDGPPFATGLPHYGHILAGTIKDIVTRYQTATGHHVTRRFSWDCHGMPVEHEINVKLARSVWWVFRELFNKGLVYQGLKVMYYSTGCKTQLSNFEATLNTKVVSDPEVMGTNLVMSVDDDGCFTE